MTTQRQLDTGEALAAILDALDRLDADRTRLSDAARLALVDDARVLAGRLDALLCALVAEADAANSALHSKGTPTTSWLALSGKMSRKESAGLLFRARALVASDSVRQAALKGTIGVGQARAITRVLEDLPESLDVTQRQRAASALIEYASRFDAGQLASMAEQVLHEVSPEVATETASERLQRHGEAALRRRSLWFVREQQGSVSFRGSLPTADAEGWIAIIDAYVESQRRTVLERRDPLAEMRTPQQRRADGLLAMIRDHTARRLAPSGGGDRPRVVVTMDYDALHRRAVEHGLLATGQLVGPGDLRRLCCDADLIPAVLGGASEILDVGRTQRLVTRGIRNALVQRDSGCVFPGCDTHPTACEAHHIEPWYRGGATALSNLVLLCHHHHGVVEPARLGVRDKWMVRIAADGVAETIPPKRIDPHQSPLRHQRFLRRALAKADAAADAAGPGIGNGARGSVVVPGQPGSPSPPAPG